MPQYLNSFHNHLSWLSDNGRFIFAESTTKAANESFHHELVKQAFSQLISNGWGFCYEFGDFSNPLDLNNVTLYKTREGTVEDNLHKLKQFYIELSEHYNPPQAFD